MYVSLSHWGLFHWNVFDPLPSYDLASAMHFYDIGPYDDFTQYHG